VARGGAAFRGPLRGAPDVMARAVPDGAPIVMM
jgi:hypothetical protein